ncbi:PREDICTED: AAA-ATPase At2g18193-like [Tarenaya hassleriana]|uniref:AAA-ATPase At2g18193-like n=1 Tax=Tarenaya hassleriana TaxID=28532 RepID=UPI00053C61EB|nr:PREDICTED: AAA-ATPase At2g18193-like [Tarenaya hassleriana]
MFSSSEISRTASTLFAAYASLTGFLMLLRSMFYDFVPEKLRSYVSDFLHRFFTPKSNDLTIIVDENFGMSRNHVFDAAELYLRTKIGPKTERLRVGKTTRQKHFTLMIEKGEEIVDSFGGFDLKWSYVQTESEKGDQSRRYYELTFEKKFRDRVMSSYLDHVVSESEEIRRNLRTVKLYSRDVYSNDDDDNCAGGNWGCVNLEHPSTFETLAMDPEAKKKIIADLDRFLRRREFYKRVGKAWKRGYLLYGPPGTGKSTLIAAMANYLKFDVFDLELSNIYDNADLKRVLLSTTNRSILVIEDIDCNAEVRDREADDHDAAETNRKVTLSGILNFIDGLWSSCGDERLIVFTTNHKDRLDPALLRPGRMDVHIHMSYLTSKGFRTLVYNYLGLDGQNHPLCEEIECLIDSIYVTPAEVAEELMQDDDPGVVLRGLLGFLEKKKAKISEVKGEVTESEKKVGITASDNDEKPNRRDGKKKKAAGRKGKNQGKGRKKMKPLFFNSMEVTRVFSNMLSAYASLTGFMMMMRSMFNDIIPEQFRSYITDFFARFFTKLDPDHITVIVEDYSGEMSNQLFEAAETYLRTRMSSDTKRVRASKTPGQKEVLVSFDEGQEILDYFEGMELRWVELKTTQARDDDGRHFELTFEKSCRDRVLQVYLPRLISASEEIKQREKTLRLYSRSLRYNCSGGWGSVYLEHPSTFDTLAMDSDLKKMIIGDLERFLKRKDLYKRVGKAWKRGYLLYGPPGTGKSSLIAAMANYLKFDVYELELTSVYSDSELKRILLSTSNQSILVIEDIDCSDETMDRSRKRSRRRRQESSSQSELTLSGILNCIDGLWSSCGDERIFIFTTNHKDRLDPALLQFQFEFQFEFEFQFKQRRT